MPASVKQVVTLYRTILRAARHYPSSKRDSIAAEIRSTFHANKDLSDRREIDSALQQAGVGLSELRQYSNLEEDESGGWTLQLRGNTLSDSADAESQIKGR
jgi:Complex 1 protein (LYR family)